ncbi:MAG: MMPL family transporter [Acidimicrobiia bacterium]|nr:MMPL family transporter [Acidimicrobiia bacterium]
MKHSRFASPGAPAKGDRVRRLGRFIIRRRWTVLLGAAVFLVVAGIFGSSAISRLSSGGFDDPASESSRALEALRNEFDSGTLNYLLLVTAKDGVVTDPDVVEAGLALTEELKGEEGVSEAFSYWSLGNVAQLAEQADPPTRALVLARIEGDEDEVVDRVEELSPRYTRDLDAITVEVSGEAEIFRAVSAQAEEDLQRAELISTPLTLLLLLVVFGGVVAAALPLSVAALAVVGTLVILRVISSFTEVSVFSLNLTTALGLGLAIDYSLFIVSRYREELRNGRDPDAAVLRTMQTAGRTIAFSALTVAVSLSALLVFPMPYLRSFAYAGVGVVALAGLGAVVFLPALIAVLGHNVDRFLLWRRPPKPVGTGFWHKVARAVMRRPIPIALAVVAFLLFLGTPFLHIELSLSDERVLYEDAEVRQTTDTLRKEFSAREVGALLVVAPGAGAPDGRQDDIADYATALSAIEGVDRVDAVTGFYQEGAQLFPPISLNERYRGDDGFWFSVVPGVEPFSPEGEELTESIRDLDAPFEVLVGGPSAQLVDGKDALFSRLPVALAVIAVTTFILLFFMVGSLLVPVKALVLNLLSLTATFGAMVWVFQDGHLQDLLDFTPTGAIDIFTPVLMFCVAFGLSMDYEVFLLSRIKEEYDIDQDNETAVAVGLERTGRIVTAAAILLAVVFIAFATSKVSIIKLIGLGQALAVIVDAFLIRATLVPAFMRLAGRANWWAPRRLRRVYLRYGVWETEPLAILDVAEADGVDGRAPVREPVQS